MDSHYCIEDVSCYLNTTKGLFAFLIEKCFEDSAESVMTREAILDTRKHKQANKLLCSYGHISSCLTILSDRVQEAAAMLERITEARLKAKWAELEGGKV